VAFLSVDWLESDISVTLKRETDILQLGMRASETKQQQTWFPSIRRSSCACQVHTDKNKWTDRLCVVSHFIYWLSIVRETLQGVPSPILLLITMTLNSVLIGKSDAMPFTRF
jgi:hypothetical protein